MSFKIINFLLKIKISYYISWIDFIFRSILISHMYFSKLKWILFILVKFQQFIEFEIK
jgi:hypothetical protein